MKRKIFEEKGYTVKGHVLPYEDFRLFADLKDGFRINPAYHSKMINEADEILKKELNILSASDYMLYAKNGNRSVYEDKYRERRDDMIKLSLAETITGEGKYIGRILDLVWQILEESTWVVPAHLPPKSKGVYSPLPTTFGDDTNCVDLYAARTGMVLSFTYYMLKDRFDEISETISERIVRELKERTIQPFIKYHDRFWWYIREGANNWNPQVISDVLGVTALTERDLSVREQVTELAIKGLDRFVVGYDDDGGCDEGPDYWTGAGGALYNAGIILLDITGGYINIFDDPLMKNMGEYICKVYAGGGRYYSYSDAHPVSPQMDCWIYDWANLIHSDRMKSLFASQSGGRLASPLYLFTCYRTIRELSLPIVKKQTYLCNKTEYIKSLSIAVTHETTDPECGLFLAFKGGNNNESHNHNDVGSFIVYSDGNPVLIDAGVGKYTQKTFSIHRYQIWNNCSEYHNTPLPNGIPQKVGAEYRSKNPEYDEKSGKLTLDLTEAYPEEARLSSLIRSCVLKNGEAVITDEVTLLADGEMSFVLMMCQKPMLTSDGVISVSGAEIRFDKRLSVVIDEPDCTSEETSVIPRKWGTDAIYRAVLTAKIKGGSKETFIMRVSVPESML
ncbi:MAG: heparinase II/III family protein [Firmicutes bacterium]|nr:heparinase II/III family protein [Candidatus Colimorpha enterica]